MTWEYPKRPGEAHEGHSHVGRPIPVRWRRDLIDLTGWKAERQVGTEAYDFLSRDRIMANRAADRIDALEQPDGLKKVKSIPFLVEGIL
jgi:hypothetical protein